MYVDALTLAAVVDELRLLLINARIDTIIQPTEHALALQCYAPSGSERGAQIAGCIFRPIHNLPVSMSPPSNRRGSQVSRRPL